MLKFNKAFLAATAILVAVSVNVSAQDGGKSDMFGQDVQGGSDGAAPSVPTYASARKLKITNATNPTAVEETAQIGSDVVTPQAYAKRPVDKSTVPGEFQKFVADNTGRLLPIFGTEFFANAPTTFTPLLNAPVPSDYPLGPGDELMIRGWGTVDIDFRATIDRNGTINIPTIGAITLAGVKAGDAETVVRGAVAKLYKGVTVSVNFGKLRAITVYVVGQARKPGTYTVSSLSTLVTALFSSGGPNANGSMRRVQVKRAGKTVAELDLYSFIAKGDKSADIKLLDGDTIYIPPAGGYVALLGKVNSPAIYELKSGNDTVLSLLDYAGGVPVVADLRRAFLERIDPTKSRPRTVEEFALDGKGLNRQLKNGDVLNVEAITPEFSNAVVLRGNVETSVRVPFKPGMRISDLIPSREYLMTRNSIRKQNETLTSSENGGNNVSDVNGIAASIGNLVDEINWDYAVIERIDRSNMTVKLVPFNLGKVFTDPSGNDNVQLQPGDTVTIFSQKDVAVPIEKRQVVVRVEGEVQVPGVYQMTAGDSLQNLLAKAGGPTSNAYLFGTAFYREEVRKEQQENLRRAVDRLEAQIRSEQSTRTANLRSAAPSDAAAMESQIRAELRIAQDRIDRLRQLQASGRIAFSLDPSDRSFSRLPQLKLENGDRLVIPARPAFVHVFGAVNVEASPLWKPNSRVKDYLKLAGTTPDADIDNVFVIRTNGMIASEASGSWLFGKIGGVEVMPGDTIVVPEKLDRQTAWAKFTQGTREWAQIFANFGLGAAAIQVLKK